jgi:hypothetical protein
MITTIVSIVWVGLGPVVLKTLPQILYQGLKAPATTIITLVMGFLTICKVTCV